MKTRRCVLTLAAAAGRRRGRRAHQEKRWKHFKTLHVDHQDDGGKGDEGV